MLLPDLLALDSLHLGWEHPQLLSPQSQFRSRRRCENCWPSFWPCRGVWPPTPLWPPSHRRTQSWRWSSYRLPANAWWASWRSSVPPISWCLRARQKRVWTPGGQAAQIRDWRPRQNLETEKLYWGKRTKYSLTGILYSLSAVQEQNLKITLWTKWNEKLWLIFKYKFCIVLLLKKEMFFLYLVILEDRYRYH